MILSVLGQDYPDLEYIVLVYDRDAPIPETYRERDAITEFRAVLHRLNEEV